MAEEKENPDRKVRKVVPILRARKPGEALYVLRQRFEGKTGQFPKLTQSWGLHPLGGSLPGCKIVKFQAVTNSPTLRWGEPSRETHRSQRNIRLATQVVESQPKEGVIMAIEPPPSATPVEVPVETTVPAVTSKNQTTANLLSSISNRLMLTGALLGLATLMFIFLNWRSIEIDHKEKRWQIEAAMAGVKEIPAYPEKSLFAVASQGSQQAQQSQPKEVTSSQPFALDTARASAVSSYGSNTPKAILKEDEIFFLKQNSNVRLEGEGEVWQVEVKGGCVDSTWPFYPLDKDDSQSKIKKSIEHILKGCDTVQFKNQMKAPVKIFVN